MPRFAEDGPSLLILDDAHEVTSTDSSDILDWLALHVPSGSRIVIAARAPGRLPLARLRVSGRLLELGPPELALSDEEAVELLRNSGVRIEASEATALNRRCEGWAGGIELAVMAGSIDQSGALIPRPVGSDHLIREYVRSEVLARFSPADVDFLLRSSVLLRLTGGLCDAVLETTGSGDVLLSLERSNALVTALDPDHVWYRYHDLFREALVAELERTDPTLPPRLRHRASEWHASQGMADEAVTYERAAGEDAAAARLVVTFAQAMYNDGRQATVVGWLDWVESSRTRRGRCGAGDVRSPGVRAHGRGRPCRPLGGRARSDRVGWSLGSRKRRDVADAAPQHVRSRRQLGAPCDRRVGRASSSRTRAPGDAWH